MISLRQLGTDPLAKLVTHVLIAALVVGLAPIPVQASLPSASTIHRTLPQLPAEPQPERNEVLVCVVVMVPGPPNLTETAFGELIAHTGTDPQPYAFTGEPYDPNVGFQYHRARWMDPAVGRFVSVDPWGGFVYETATLHRYLYAEVDPANNVDPTGRMSLPSAMSTLSISVTIAISNFGAQLAPAFARGGPVLGRLFVGIGRYAQGTGYQVLSIYQRTRPALGILENQKAGRRVIDFLLKLGDQTVWLEAKYGLPYRLGQAMTRLVGQMEAAIATGKGQVVLWTLRYPSTAQLNLTLKELGANASKVQIVSGVEGLFKWLRFYFGPA